MFGYVWLLVVLLVEAGLLYRLVGQVVEEDISWGVFGAYLAGIIAVTAILITHRDDLIGPVLGLSVIAFAFLQGAVDKLVNQSLISAMRAEDVREAEEILRTRQDIPDAYRVIGEVLYERGLYEQARDYFKRALGDGRDPDIEWKMQYCEDEVRRRRQKLQVCPQCLLECPANLRYCPSCNHYLGTRLRGLIGGRAPVLGAFLLLCGLGTLVWAGFVLARPEPWLGALVLVPIAAVLLLKRDALGRALRGVDKI